jgi:uncharacterized RDD family membrane protein YckC
MHPQTNVPDQEQHLFTQEDLFHFEDASTGQRFLNMLIDNILMNYGLSYVTGGLVGYLLGTFFPDFAMSLFTDLESMGAIFFGIILAYFNHVVYYTFCEKIFRGYTLGKLITGTRAIRTDGTELTFRDAVLRSLSRLVPFEALSIWFGDGLWHDRWTKTMVIKTR